MSDYAFSEIECKIIKAQIERRAKYRQEYLKMRTDPCKHSQEAGHVFDPALQRFLSYKACQTEYFVPTPANAVRAIFTVVLPMLSYGYLIYTQRSKKENQIRTGELRYRDRMFKLV
ncbi:unnamed protein product [Leptosia nina]|uniref:NADH dehydrogenase [ubiquinone] 1 beta subcomplex subunit 4 n=1 Tax=Leptosia nina TaxID=320188 RepID=A0AAV1J0K3_9NEOP